MSIAEMHTWFRQYAQQMGMQNVRAILPEQIDLLINTSISDITNQLIVKNVGLTNDRIVTDNSKIGQINALRTLYKVIEISIVDGNNVDDDGRAIDNSLALTIGGDDIGLFRAVEFMRNPDNPTANENTNLPIKALYLVDLAINYYKRSRDKDKAITNYYPVRIIEDAYLADTLQDFVLKPRVRTPIAVVYNSQLDLYLGENYRTANGKLTSTELIPNKLRVSYIAAPAKVQYMSDINGTDIDCDLPESMHVDILKHAVDLYTISVNGGLYSNRQQQQTQPSNPQYVAANQNS